MTAQPLHALGVADAVERLARREITAHQLVRACLERIEAEEPRVEAWEHLDPQLALEQARRIDAASPRPPLRGVPLGVKDIIATADMPTGCGSEIYRGHRPAADAACVERLRRAGAVILGKTVTTEFAVFTPGKTRNPHRPDHTPGGSSSGSAAAVAALMVPAALGTQTAGSVIRPAAYCGVLGWKPSYGLLPLDGVMPSAPSLDTLGLFARQVRDFPLLARALGAELPEVPAPATPRLGLCRSEQWPLATPAARERLERVAEALARAGAQVRELELPPGFEGLAQVQATIQAFETARSLARERAGGEERLSPKLREVLASGDAVTPEAYRAALARADGCRRQLPRALEEVDALLTPSVAGEAPSTLASTGDPAFNRTWTLLHLPCIHLPAGAGPSGLPLGVQLVGKPGLDGALLAVARWAESRLRL